MLNSGSHVSSRLSWLKVKVPRALFQIPLVLLLNKERGLYQDRGITGISQVSASITEGNHALLRRQLADMINLYVSVWMVDVTATNSVHYSSSSYCGSCSAPSHFICPLCPDHEQPTSSSSTLMIHLHTPVKRPMATFHSFFCHWQL